jgi:hypothetical protein
MVDISINYITITTSLHNTLEKKKGRGRRTVLDHSINTVRGDTGKTVSLFLYPANLGSNSIGLF